MDMSALLSKMFLFLVLMSIGYIGARRQIFTPEFTRAASKLAMNVFLSASILHSVIANPPELSGTALLQVLLVCSGVMLFGYAVAALLARLLPLKRERAPLFELLIAAMNPMFIGLPVAEVLYGSEGVFYAALVNIPFNVLIYTYGVWRLKTGGEGGMRWRDILTVPLVVTFFAVLIFAFRIPMPAVVKELVSSLAGATIPMSMIVVGASMGRVRLLDAFKEKSLYLVSLVRLIVVPVLTWLLLRLLPIDPILRGTMLVVSACPSGVIVSMLTLQYGRDAEYSSKGILLDTLLSMITIPVIVSLLP